MDNGINLGGSKKKSADEVSDSTTHIKLTAGDIVFSLINYTFCLSFTISGIVPFYDIFISAVSSPDLV
ncbi:MAG: hypothetical protein K2J76_08610, partial [Oscillospiraceae bacterium]|nr:hypothetical protein [Oscillospiraceae bacterium]